ncbi:MAG TPA: four helix bundle protein [Patescibacteria group bacterium]
MADFTKLKIWRTSHQLTIKIYKLTAKLPKEETFNLISQLRRAALSIESNIAEGEARYHSAEKIKFFINSRASASEVQTQLLVIRDLYKQLIKECGKLFDEYDILNKQINSLINYRRKTDYGRQIKK